ncbi:MAG: cytochrome-c oxidase, cbb3-type subunit III [Paracoccaceae bacterium]|jgi:cytochrome c oxidase cbb3-type subunit 3|nr:cytochrome-c oxidase, cbb3-type subunit III [Paracoccaceae bacterium]MDP7185180.1 cytochrome-c oxidase, cbb3-type subunit III [Paracoccaceae bacterium]
MSDQNKDQVGTTGHKWDEDLEEYNNPLPKWWVWVFYITIIWGIGYTIAYPAWPMIERATPGLLGYSSRAEVAADIAAVDAANAPINARLEATELTEIEADADLNTYANNAGRAVFQTFCAQCHGSGAQGAKGYPNLLDDDWLWGGDIAAIHETVSYGIRNDQSDMARYSEMPAFGEILEEDEIDQVVNYVLALSGQAPNDATLVDAGEEVYLSSCAACHADDGSGDTDQGAPNLADAIWLYGGDYDTVKATVTNSRYGVMPAWDTRLSEAEIRAVAAYVHQLGGGQ